jgi:hypothetical protein
MRQQALTDTSITSRKIPDCANGVTGFTSLNMALVDALDPDRIAIEVANYAPDSLGRVINNGAVVNFVHVILLLGPDLHDLRTPY